MIDLQWSKPSNHYRSSEWIQISFNFSEYVIGWLVEWNKYSSASTGVTRQTTSFCCLCTRRGEQWLWGGSAKGRWVRSIGEKCPSESHQHERPRAPRWRCWPNWRTAAWGVAGREGERCFNIWWGESEFWEFWELNCTWELRATTSRSATFHQIFVRRARCIILEVLRYLHWNFHDLSHSTVCSKVEATENTLSTRTGKGHSNILLAPHPLTKTVTCPST